jgi:photosystem II stability/assembly factor-like uncharacterized protein
MPRSRVLLPALLLLLVFAARSTEAGIDRWTPLGPDGGTITDLAADPQIHGTLYAGTQGGAVWKSLDGGAHWFSASAGISSFDITALAVAHGGSGRVWAGTPGGIYQTDDGGASWRRVWSVPGRPDGALDHWILSLAADPTDPLVAWAGTWAGQVLKTFDGGIFWYPVRTGNGSISGLTIHPADPDIVYTAGSLGIQRTTDGGATWHDIRTGEATTLVIDPSAPSILYSDDFPGISKSTDSGATWTPLTGIDGFARGLFLDPNRPSVLLAGTSAGTLVRSEDAGATWQEVEGLPLLLAFTFTADSSGRLWLGVDRRGVFRSLDGGITWRATNRGLAGSLIWDVAFDPFRPRTLYASVEGTRFHRSTDGGATWTRSNAGLPVSESGTLPVYDLATDVHLPGVLYAGTDYGVYRSRDRGGRWSRLLLSEGEITSIAVHPRRRGLMFAVGEEVYRTLDGGRTWKRLLLPERTYEPKHSEVVLDPLRPRNVFVLDFDSRRNTAQGLFRSTDTGETWQLVFQGGPTALAISPAPSAPMVLGTEEGGEIWKSVDRGSTWNRIAEGVGNGAKITALLIDPTRSSVLYAGTDGAGVWRSLDGGVTWAPLATGMIALRITSLEADPRNPRRLLAGTQGGGVLEIRLTTP